jgi:hypothetical protein
MLALLRGVRQLASISVELPRWWCSGRGSIGKASFNKRALIFFCSKSSLLLPPLSRGGSPEFDGGMLS